MSVKAFTTSIFAFLLHSCILFKQATKGLLTMQDPNFSYIPIQQYMTQVGKWIKQQYIDQFGEEPKKLPHKIITDSGHTVDTAVYYYPSPWLKALFKVN
jgi:hypothetical protein